MKLKDFQRHPEISQRRKALYYSGTALIVLGIVLCFGAMLTLILGMGQSAGFGFQNFGPPPQFLWFFIGMILAVIGGVLQNLGAKGLAGSGAVLDPQRAREDLAPYSDALGGIVHDAVQGFRESGEKTEAPQEQIRVRCRNCRALNADTAKFCDQCGQEL